MSECTCCILANFILRRRSQSMHNVFGFLFDEINCDYIDGCFGIQTHPQDRPPLEILGETETFRFTPDALSAVS